ncbi:hypothetical protein Acr_25g0010090 [Actinidia rufa]|uniref:Uncharacterized protein n=1 Tax=Actinidia rufa TaxID=165716 RepID=A0A7J0H0J0_9ERIC|nr:hypothetical protein Acr_25g0010090 [Actinidia rufa]
MGDEGFEEWDADFLDQLIQVEELALSSTNPTLNPPPPPRPPASHFLPPPRTAVPYDEISYSPPRELSQRVRDGTTKDFARSLGGVVDSAPSRNPKEEEIEQLKVRDFSTRKSARFGLREQDCLQLREERDKKEEQLKSVYSQIEAKDAEVQCRKSKNLGRGAWTTFIMVNGCTHAMLLYAIVNNGREYGVHSRDQPVLFLGCQNGNSSNNQVGSRLDLGTSTCKAIGVQTEISGESTHLSSKNDLSTCQRRRSNLLAVWDSPKGKGSSRNLVSKLLVACETDFHVLFGCLSLSFKAGMKSLADEQTSDVGLRDHNPPTQSAEAAKVSHLYYMLTKIGTGMVKLEALFGALVDLCSVENVPGFSFTFLIGCNLVFENMDLLNIVVPISRYVILVCASTEYSFQSLVQGLPLCLLCATLSDVLNVILELTSKLHQKILPTQYPVLRDSIIVEGSSSQNNTADTCGPESAETRSLHSMGANEISDSGLIAFGTRLFNVESLCDKEQKNRGSAVSTSCLDWGAVFELMHQIATRNTEECARLEAVSIMNMILMRSNAYF